MNNFIFSYQTAIDMTKLGKVNVKPLITHHFKLEDALDAFETHKNQTGDPIKILIHTNPKWQPS